MNSKVLGDKGGDSKLLAVFLNATQHDYENMAYIVCLIWSLSAPAVLIFRDYFNTYLITVLGTLVFFIYYVFGKALRWMNSYAKNRSSIKEIITSVRLRFVADLKNRPWNLLLGGMLIWSFISFIFAAEDKLLAITGTASLKEGVSGYCFYAIIYVCASLINDEQRRLRCLKIFIFGSIIPAALFVLRYCYSDTIIYSCVSQLVRIYDVNTSIFQNSNYYGYYLATAIPCLMILSIITDKFRYRIVYYILMLAEIVILRVNDTYGSYIGIYAAAIILPIICCLRRSNNQDHFSDRFKCSMKFFLRSLLPLIAVLLVSVTMKKYNRQISNIDELMTDIYSLVENDENVEIANSAGSGRWGLWKTAIMIIKEHPLHEGVRR